MNQRLRLLPFIVLAFSLASATASSLNITICEFDAPTLNSRPHDPAIAPDGALQYTGQLANKLGRLDPMTGEIKEFPLTTPYSGPHGLVANLDGNIQCTVVFKGDISKLDPRSGKVTEYPNAGQTSEGPAQPGV